MVAAVLIGGLLALGLAVPLAWKWELGVPRSALAVCAIALGVAAVVVALDALVGLAPFVAAALTAALTLGVAAAIVLWRFFRDPERTSPDGAGLVVSPADGLVIYVHRSERGELPVSTKQGRRYALDELVRTPLRSDDAIVVGIALSFLDVHVNRAPIAGAVRVQQRFPGPFASLKHPSAVYSNERSTTLLERDGLQVAVVLIASRLVRRIVSYVKQGDDVALGQRIGAIRFGSQVDVVMPETPGLRVLVTPGERVVAGQTPIAEVEQ
jgi:phosphatidylserine decarboxylase